jgi:hypothetical protein
MWLKMQISSSLDMKRHAYVSYCHHFVPVAIISLAMRLLSSSIKFSHILLWFHRAKQNKFNKIIA